ncbi:MAG: phosphoglycerate dehydrogenase [Gammaproteobacteria bacterium]|nr:phosphoglycerate dehydrogenase [Gammaproteobacteria bacterium]MYC25709.1 phosphoglycerate dehydrogenase [Gammaproteobacteria bacterium]
MWLLWSVHWRTSDVYFEWFREPSFRDEGERLLVEPKPRTEKFRIQTFNQIATRGLKLLATPQYSVSKEQDSPHAIILRSFPLTTDHLTSNLLAIARAGAGVNNVPVDECTEQGILVFNTPGANANSVKELVIAALLLCARDVIGGIEYVNNLPNVIPEGDLKQHVEEGKRRFAGRELSGRTLGVVGLGAIGTPVANIACTLGMQVLGYDPFLSETSRQNVDSRVELVDELKDLFARAQFISLHVPLSPKTNAFVNDELLNYCHEGTCILNFARSEVVAPDAILRALEHGQLSKYFIDFPRREFLNHPKVFTTPHLGASTAEAEENCAVMAVRQIQDFLVNGNIENSVNFPSVKLERSLDYRFTITNWNQPGVLREILAVCSNVGLNITDMINKSRENVAYNILEVDGEVTDSLRTELLAVPNVVRVRALGRRNSNEL